MTKPIQQQIAVVAGQSATTTAVDRYFDVISDGPLMIVRIPCIRREFSGRDALEG
jgi:hypothetical protein